MNDLNNSDPQEPNGPFQAPVGGVIEIRPPRFHGKAIFIVVIVIASLAVGIIISSQVNKSLVQSQVQVTDQVIGGTRSESAQGRGIILQKESSQIKEFVSLGLHVQEVQENKNFQSRLDPLTQENFPIGFGQPTRISLGGTDVDFRMIEAVEDSSFEKILCTSNQVFCERGRAYAVVDVSVLSYKRCESV